MIEKENNFEQAGIRWRSFDEARQHRFAMRVAGTLSEPRVDREVLDIWIQNWTEADSDLAALIISYLNEISGIKAATNAGLLLSNKQQDIKTFYKKFHQTSNCKVF